MCVYKNTCINPFIKRYVVTNYNNNNQFYEVFLINVLK